jgi:hypothetical protein
MNRIAIELDEILFPFIKPMTKHYDIKLPSRRLHHYTHRELLGVSNNECNRMVKEYFETESFKLTRPLDGSETILRLLKPRFEKVYLVSNRPDYMRDYTEQWVNFYFPGIFDDIIFANNYLHRQELEKSDICNSLRLDTLIDDDELDCAVCFHRGMNVIHFAGENGKVYPWSRYDQWSVLGWNEVYSRVHNFDKHNQIEIV